MADSLLATAQANALAAGRRELAGRAASPGAEKPRRGNGTVGGQVRRHATGRLGHALLDPVLRAYETMGRGVFSAVHFPVEGAPQRMYPTGKGDCDYVGHALVPGAEGLERVPVVFDLKVHRASTYYHDDGALHQLERLLRWRHIADARAFVLLLDPEQDTATALYALEHLYGGGGVQYRTSRRGAWTWRDEPSVRVVRGASAVALAGGAPRWDFLSVL